MKLGLSMIIKNEASKISQCIGHIIDLFDDVVIFDTGSTDNTVEVVKGLGITVESYEILHKDQYRLIEARNASIEKNKCERVLILDGDETISREDIVKIKEYTPTEDVSGFFLKRVDHRYTTPFEDYKMCIINRNKIRFLFSVHACPQVYARDNGEHALRMHGVTLHHYPEIKEYRDSYITQILDGITENPGCLRFYRFLGYIYYKKGEYDKAKEALEFLVKNKNNRFPVEILNSLMVLASLHQQQGNNIQAFHCLQLGIDYYKTVQDDFEIKINFRQKKRFDESMAAILTDPNTIIIPYEFAY